VHDRVPLDQRAVVADRPAPVPLGQQRPSLPLGLGQPLVYLVDMGLLGRYLRL
jgi:hypothetical protein